MTEEDAGKVVALMNAGFPRESLEPVTVGIWVNEIGRLARADAALEAAHVIVRNGERFPTMSEFRGTYRQALDRLSVGSELEEPFEAVPPPPEAKHLLDAMRTSSILKDIP